MKTVENLVLKMGFGDCKNCYLKLSMQGKGATFVKPGVVPSTKNKVFPRSYFNLVKNSKVLVNSVIMIETKIKHFMFLLILKSMYTKTFKKKSKEK